LIDPEDDDSSAADGGEEEGVGTSVVAGVDMPPVLELAEDGLDLAVLAIEGAGVSDLYLVIGL